MVSIEEIRRAGGEQSRKDSRITKIKANPWWKTRFSVRKNLTWIELVQKIAKRFHLVETMESESSHRANTTSIYYLGLRLIRFGWIGFRFNSVRTKLYRTGRESVRPVYPLVRVTFWLIQRVCKVFVKFAILGLSHYTELRAKPATTATDHSPRRSFQVTSSSFVSPREVVVLYKKLATLLISMHLVDPA